MTHDPVSRNRGTLHHISNISSISAISGISGICGCCSHHYELRMQIAKRDLETITMEGDAEDASHDHDHDDDDAASTRDCFTSVQSRKLWAPLTPSACRMCPSMDLVVLGLGAKSKASQHHQQQQQQQSSSTAASASEIVGPATALWIHRTVSWQKLSQITVAQGSDEQNEAVSAPLKGAQCVTWSPDGRHLAVACDGLIEIHSVENLSNDTGDVSAGGVSVNAGAGDDALSDADDVGTQVHRVRVAGKIVGLFWAHIGRPHPMAWRRSVESWEEDISWSYQSRYVDRASAYLPPSAYHSTPNHSDAASEANQQYLSELPKCTKPMSIMCAATSASLDVFVHGRYHLLSLPRPPLRMDDLGHLPCVEMACSQDLTKLILHAVGTSQLSIVTLPMQFHKLTKIQCFASLSSHINTHLQVLQRSTTEIGNSWRSSLKPLHDKITPLSRLLKNYNVQESIPSVLRKFINLGHTTHNADIANAIDQFFTGIQMNDQLVQRMERTLQASVANVEVAVRKGLMGPARALVFNVQELAAVIRSDFDTFVQAAQGQSVITRTAVHSSPSASESIDQQLTDMLLACQAVLLRAEGVLAEIIQARFRLSEFIVWLRSTGSQIKARGTAPNSVQRDNAMKRRAPQGVVDRLLQYLRASTTTCTQGRQSLPLVEKLLNLQFTCVLTGADNGEKEKSVEVETMRSTSPKSATEELALSSAHQPLSSCLKSANTATQIVLSYPRRVLSTNVVPYDLILPKLEQHSSQSNGQPRTPRQIVAIQTRIGRDSKLEPFAEQELQEMEESGESHTFFSPHVTHIGDDSSEDYHCRQWCMIAQAGMGSNCIQLFAIPLSTSTNDMDDGEDSMWDTPFTLTTKISLPHNVQVHDVKFYSDDGKSALSSGHDQGTGEEGARQKLCILTKQDAGEDDDEDNDDDNRADPKEAANSGGSSDAILQIWMMGYENLNWHASPHETILPGLDTIDSSCIVQVTPFARSEDLGAALPDGELHASTRMIGIVPNDLHRSDHQEGTYLMLSGSRGIGGVVVNHGQQGWSSLELFDLEEDEDDEESESFDGDGSESDHDDPMQ